MESPRRDIDRRPGYFRRTSTKRLTQAIVRAVLAVRTGQKRLPTLPPVSREILATPHRASDRTWVTASLEADIGLANRTLEMLGGGRQLRQALAQRSPRHVYAACAVAVFERDLLQSLPESVAMVLRRRAMRRAAVAHEVARIAGADAVMAYVDGLLTDLGALVLLRLDPRLAQAVDACIEESDHSDGGEIDRIVALVGDDLMDRTVELWLGADWAQRRAPSRVRQVTAIVCHHTRRVDDGGARPLGTHELAPLVRLGIEARTFSELCSAARGPVKRSAA